MRLFHLLLLLVLTLFVGFSLFLSSSGTHDDAFHVRLRRNLMLDPKTMKKKTKKLLPMLPKDAFNITASQWRQWLALNGRNFEVEKFRMATLNGCGATAIFSFDADDQGPDKGFFKTFHKDDGESHYSEIKAGYLGKMLGVTSVVLPTVGYRLRSEDIKDVQIRNAIAERIACAHENADVIEGSMTLWHKGVYNVSKETVFQACQDQNNSTKNQAQHDSCIRYAVFLYLGACTKTDHNHFAHGDGQFLAIDNDRCFATRGENSRSIRRRDVIKEWKKLVFDNCLFPSDLVLAIYQAATLSEHETLSNRLMEALRDDALSEKLLQSSQQQSFHEIDYRVQNLACHMQQCQEERKLVLPYTDNALVSRCSTMTSNDHSW